MAKIFDEFLIKKLISKEITAEDIGLDDEAIEFLKENYKNYSIKDLAELVEVPIQLLKAFLFVNNIATYTLSSLYPDGYSFCTRCKRVLPYDAFYKNKSKKNNCQTLCKECDTKRKINEYKKERKGTYNKTQDKPKLSKVEKIAFIRQNYRTMTAKEIANHVNLSESRIFQIAAEYNIKKNNKVKKCCSCKRLLPISKFNRKSTSSDGYTSRCKECLAIYRKLRQADKNISLEEINKVSVEHINSISNKDTSNKFDTNKISPRIKTEQKNMTEKELMLQRIQNKYKNKTVSKKEIIKLKRNIDSDYIEDLKKGKYVCSQCHKVKAGTEFYYSKRDKKLETICKQCKKENNKKSYLKEIENGTQW